MAIKFFKQQLYEENQKARGMVKVSVWVPKQKRDEIIKAAKEVRRDWSRRSEARQRQA